VRDYIPTKDFTQDESGDDTSNNGSEWHGFYPLGEVVCGCANELMTIK